MTVSPASMAASISRRSVSFGALSRSRPCWSLAVSHRDPIKTRNTPDLPMACSMTRRQFSPGRMATSMKTRSLPHSAARSALSRPAKPSESSTQ
jgi:hypothetical protein